MNYRHYVSELCEHADITQCYSFNRLQHAWKSCHGGVRQVLDQPIIKPINFLLIIKILRTKAIGNL